MSRYKTIKPDAEMLDRAVGYFNKFTQLELADMLGLASYCEFREFDKRTVIVREGEVDDYLNLVIKGLVVKYVRVKKSKPILQMATEGHLISSEVSFLTRTPSQVYLETLEPTVLISMRFNKMEEALEHYPKGEEMGRKMLELMYIRKDERKYAWKIMNTRERFIDYINKHPHMLQRVSQKYLASYLNIKPETFSRLKHLVRKKA
jgi:CRP-like cAMP-binding protein